MASVVGLLARNMGSRISLLAGSVDSSLTVEQVVAAAYAAGVEDSASFVCDCDFVSRDGSEEVRRAASALSEALSMLRHPSSCGERCSR